MFPRSRPLVEMNSVLLVTIPQLCRYGARPQLRQAGQTAVLLLQQVVFPHQEQQTVLVKEWILQHSPLGWCWSILLLRAL